MSPFPLPTKKLKEFIDWSRDRWMNNSMQQGTLKFLTDKSLPQAWLRKSRSKVSHSDLEKDLGDLAPNQFILPGILGMWSSEPLKVKVKLLSRVWLFATPWTVPYQDPPSTRILHPRDFPGKSTGVGCHFLLPFGHKGNINKSLCFLTPALYFFLVHHKLCEKRFACKTRYLKKLWWNYFLISKSFTYSKEGYVKYIEIF